MENEVLEFIKRRFTNNCNWLNGNCFYFAAILTMRFPEGEIYYLPIEGHFVTKIEDVYYDWTGIVSLKEKPISFMQLRKEDPLLYSHLIRDCVM